MTRKANPVIAVRLPPGYLVDHRHDLRQEIVRAAPVAGNCRSRSAKVEAPRTSTIGTGTIGDVRIRTSVLAVRRKVSAYALSTN